MATRQDQQLRTMDALVQELSVSQGSGAILAASNDQCARFDLPGPLAKVCIANRLASRQIILGRKEAEIVGESFDHLRLFFRECGREPAMHQTAGDRG